ncbi:MAG: glycine--tRNA ligase subunit beta [Desulfobacterota bacterium]|nr:glycine--tRNA ligase subunit beta [Thermodesulfobacteriota bacterium]MDW8002548.1 glycine--tRNA ligase subunit beta [Deltaproteobacteria bacterium]
MKTLLFEIGTEELPARFIEGAKEGFKKALEEAFYAKRIKFGEINVFATPRRLAALVFGVSPKQEEIVILKYGPPVTVAYDEKGTPLKPALGFAKSQGVAIDDLKKVEKDGVLVLACEKKEGGKDTEDILPEIVGDVISKIPFPKKMRWGFETFEFARPIQWLCVILDGKVIDVKIADVKSGNLTYGHRFLTKGPIVINNPLDYVPKLKEAYVIVDENERMRLIMEGIEKIEKETGSKAVFSEELLKEILYITEFPYAMKGSFDPIYLTLPYYVVINVMQSHQRYIPLVGENGVLKPYFIFFANTLSPFSDVIVKGNEKVLKARLDDAKFYFEEDKRMDFFSLYERLDSVVFHEKLGTMKEKAERVEKIAGHLADLLNFKDISKLKRASKLLKVDLLTHMVAEFPELQGKMGRIYAQLRGEDEEVSYAIEEHYLPLSSEGELPKTRLGIIMSIADKIDTLVSFFSVGITPTGNLDPYGLRRCAIGLVRTIVGKELHISLGDLISFSYLSASHIEKRLPLDVIKTELLNFIATRFKFLMIDEGYEYDLVESVLSFAHLDLFDAYLRLCSLKEVRSVPEFEKLIVGFKRVFNITKKVEDSYEVKRELFEKEEEETLLSVYEVRKEPYYSYIKERKYKEAVRLLMDFKEPIDRFFDRVFVMVDDERIRKNRLGLLKRIKDMFTDFCDFERIKSD